MTLLLRFVPGFRGIRVFRGSPCRIVSDSVIRLQNRPHLYVVAGRGYRLVAAAGQAILGCIIQFVVLSFMSRLSGLRFSAARRQLCGQVLCFAALLLPSVGFASGEHADRIVSVSTEELAAAQTPEVSEGSIPPPPKSSLVESSLFAAFGASAQQQQGVLSGKIVYMNSGHGWTFDPTYWRLQRGVGNEMNEDYGNLDQLNFFAQYCFNAGATVVSMRPLGHQTNEVILDNDSPGVVFAGSWSDSSQTTFWGTAGDVPYRFATLSATETATATYTPTIPVAGFYPVYTWVLAGSDRGEQLYRIRHTGGESLVRIPHHMVGNGWIYLGEYHFNAGANAASGSVVVSNLRGSAQGGVVIADAIRFGNGMGSVDRGGGVSGYPREDESMRYWVQANLAQGQSVLLYDSSDPDYDDEQDSWSAPPKMSAHMNRAEAGDIYDRIHISFHSNASTNTSARGTVALITGDPTPNQEELAEIVGGEVNDDLVALGSPPLEFPWFNKSGHTYTGGYGEIDGSSFGYEMPATIVEVAFHTSPSDAAIMRDAKGRAAVARATLHGVIKFMNAYDTNGAPPLAFLPEAPTNLRALAGTNGQISFAWTAPVSSGGSQSPTNYLLYRSTNGFGFGTPVSVGNVTSYTVSNLTAGVDYYFRVTAANAGGESMPSETVGCRAATTNNAPRVLVVNAFDRLDRSANLRHSLVGESWDPPGNSGSIERVFPRWNNAFDYIVAHGKAVAAAGWAFDSCQNEAVANNQVALSNYAIVIWAAGNEGTADETFSATEQTRLTTYLAAGGALFASGAEIAYDLGRVSGPTPADRNFLQNQLHASFSADSSGSYTATTAPAGIFAGRASATFDNGNNGIYWVKAPDAIAPVGSAVTALSYSGGTGGAAAIQYDGAVGNGRVVVFGFPFETITSATRRNEYMLDILNFLKEPGSTNVPPSIVVPPQSGYVVIGSNAPLSVIAGGSPTLSYQWRFNGTNIPAATSASYTRVNAQPVHSGYYAVIVSNAWGTAESETVLLEVMLPPLQTLWADNFDVNTAANWVTNRSSTDTRVTFNYNYTPDGIPPAPNSIGGTTRGVKFEANLVNGAVAAINISPVGQSFPGDYRLRFDMWINANGPFPDGGTGSTEHLTAGVGTAGNRVQWNTGTADGVWFAADGEGQATDTHATVPDWRAYVGTALQQTNSGVYVGGSEPNIRGNGHPYYASTFPGGQTAPALQQSNYAQQTGALAVGTVGFAWRDVIIAKTGNTVEWSIAGLKIAAVTNANLTASNIFIGYWDSFASLSDNTNLSFGLVDNVRVERFVTNVPPYLTAQPESATAATGNDIQFNVTAGGTAALAYQWSFTGTNIAGATSSSFTRLNAQAIHAGDYSVVVTNGSGSVTSAVATLTLTPSLPLQFTFIAALPDGKVSLGVTGDPGFSVLLQTSTNLVDWAALTNLLNPTGTLVFTNEPATEVPYQFFRALYP
jgi:hypothetical protein